MVRTAAVFLLVASLLAGCDYGVAGTRENTTGKQLGSTPWLLAAIGTGDGPNYEQVLRFFAPRYYQGYAAMADLITNVTYDGDWNTVNNWENLGAYPTKGYGYASLIEDSNRCFHVSAVFHPRVGYPALGSS